MSFVRHYSMTTSPDKAEAFRQKLVDLRAAVSGCAGSLRVDLLQIDGEPHRFFFIEHWQTRDDHTAAGAQLPAPLMKSLKVFLVAAPEANNLMEVERA